MTTNEFSRLVTVGRQGARDRNYSITATKEECEALAKRFSILAVEGLSAEIALTPAAGGRLLRLQGRLSADVVQACVVTLAPVPAHVEEEFSLAYSLEPVRETENEIVVDFSSEDPPEPVENGSIDIGEAAAEHLALALDPFPRAPGASFDGLVEDEAPLEPEPEPRRSGAFDALAALKKK